MSLSFDQFYTQISPHKEELSTLVQHSEYFVAVPETWQVVITDIKKSTQAVESGSQGSCQSNCIRKHYCSVEYRLSGKRPLFPFSLEGMEPPYLFPHPYLAPSWRL